MEGTKGVTATLTLDVLLDEGPGVLYPDPETMSFVVRGEDFQQAEACAVSWTKEQGLWDPPYDVRWKLERQDGNPLDHVDGGSAGAAIALGLGKLLADAQPNRTELLFDSWRKLDFTGLAASARVTPTGNLAVVSGLRRKLMALRDHSFPRVHTVVVDCAQKLPKGLVPVDGDWNIVKDPGAEFRVLKAPSIDEARMLITSDTKTRWSIDCAIPRRNSSFVGREKLIEHVRDFIEKRDSGYLVLIGLVGQGKSTFLAEWIRREQERLKEAVVYHILGREGTATATMENVATCLYGRLRRKWRFVEPVGWKGTDADKLELFLAHLSDNELRDRKKEVLYIDAADQVAATPLLPGALRELPPGVLCVITSRAKLDWLGTAESVTRWELDTRHVDDRSDIRSFLKAQSRHLSKPLPARFIEEIVRHPKEVPVFFTVAAGLRELEDPAATEEERNRWRTDAARWRFPAEETIRSEALRAIAKAGREGITERTFWRTLGLHATAAEELSEENLEELGLWEEGVTDRVLRLAANFFRARPILRAPSVPFFLDHPGYRREISYRRGARGAIDCHRALAEGCRAVLARRPSSTSEYALRHRLGHLIEGHEWEKVGASFGDGDFILKRSRRFGFAGVHRDAAAAAAHPALGNE
jgi:hypothetical protein